jgi:subtilisin family serine protease
VDPLRTEPGKRQDLLLTPLLDQPPASLMWRLRHQLRADRRTAFNAHEREQVTQRGASYGRPSLASNLATVAARLWFSELVRDVLPLTEWWTSQLAWNAEPDNTKPPQWKHPVEMVKDDELRSRLEDDLQKALRDPNYDSQRGSATAALAWLARVVGTIQFLADRRPNRGMPTIKKLEEGNRDVLGLVRTLFRYLSDFPDPLGMELTEDEGIPEDIPVDPQVPFLFSVNRNREIELSMFQSVPTVKADAAQQLFTVRGAGITWAVLDTGIDATHWAFRKRDPRDKSPLPTPFAVETTERGQPRLINNTRVKKTYDFTKVRDLLSLDLVDEEDEDGELAEGVKQLPKDVRDNLRKALKTGRMIEWEEIEPLLRIDQDDSYRDYHIPKSHHGTHVAGILAADWRHDDDPHDHLPFHTLGEDRPPHRTGVAPEISLYDLRVVDERGRGSEFAVMAALQFVRSLNSRRDYVEIHGVNVSLSLKHEVSNYACGRTPVCTECETLIGSGIAVVASAGNQGRVRFLTKDGDLETYSSISITDPGNTEMAITVGATHGREPHTYGVSYFSSRGPTGDGRMKPDLVAPGEKIVSTVPGNGEEYLDGTSMAAPHVSGAAALLMSRNPELVGDPMRIKEILCSTATDLGRERYFQGAGLLDVLRALQSI